jgi:hypothetical protein
LFDAATLDEIRRFPFHGRPCLDAARRQAFFVYGREVRGFDATTGAIIGSMPLPVLSTDDWADACVRWGLDGLAILGDNFVHLVRWSQIIPENADDNGNAIPDRWEAAHLGPFGGDLAADPDGDGLPSVMEYIFGTAAGKATADPREVGVTEAGLVRLVFPRRAGLAPGWYAYQVASDLDTWGTVTPVSETVMTTQTIDGVEIETVEVLIEMPAGGAGYVRLVAPPR